MEIRFVVADASGIRDLTEYGTAFERAGCAVEFTEPLRLEDGRPNSPGPFIGVPDQSIVA